MKKMIISIAAASALLFTGCFFDSDTATVQINLGNMPIAKVEKKSLIDRFLLFFAKEAVAQTGPGDFDVTTVHIGAFDSNNQLLAKKSINVTAGEYPENNIVSFDVPARNGVTIVVLGEKEIMGSASSTYEISYYGKSAPQSLTAGEIKDVSIEVFDLKKTIFADEYSDNFLNCRHTSQEEGNAKMAWNTIFGSSKINIEYERNYETHIEYVGIYSGSGNSCINDKYNLVSNAYQITLHFDFAGSSSEPHRIDNMP